MFNKRHEKESKNLMNKNVYSIMRFEKVIGKTGLN